MSPRAVLVGLPGVGKSTVGARLAQRFSVPFADSDQLIVDRAGRSVPEIFRIQGEPAFRVIEAEVIAGALADFDGVLALGGGAVTSESVRRALREAGVPVVLLTAPESELLRRIGRSQHRPLLAGDPATRLAELVSERSALYEQVATMTICTVGRSANTVVTLLHQKLTSPQECST